MRWSKLEKWPLAAPQSTNAPDEKSHFGGARNMAMAIGNIKRWRGKSKNVLAR
jgi:hypothetical protein